MNRSVWPVRVYYRGSCVAEDYLLARDYAHALRLAAYCCRALARDQVHPADFESDAVTFDVLDPVDAADIVA
jgi:hypothetical protein